MRILCVSDQVDPLVYSTGMRDRFKDIDLVISAGDLAPEYLEFIVSSLNKPLLYVLGNHDQPPARSDDEDDLLPFASAYQQSRVKRIYSRDSLSGASDLSSRVRREAGLILVGQPGCRRYNRGPNQYTDAQMWLKVLAVVPQLLLNRLFHGRYLDILVTHAPPEGIHDRKDCCHHGFRSYLWLMRAFKPRYLIHGHTHLYDLNDVRVSRYLSTTVVNAFSHYVLDTENEDARHST